MTDQRSAASVREPLFPTGCTCPSYGKGLTMTRVNSRSCPIHANVAAAPPIYRVGYRDA